MLSFTQFISENVSESDIRGKMHENLVHYNLNGGKHSSVEHEKELHKLKGLVSDEEYSNAVGRAKHATDYIKKHIIGDREVSRVERTSKPGETGDTQSDNPSDLVVHYKDGTKHGLSLKASKKKNANVPISNPGVGTIQKVTGVDTSSRYKKIKDAFRKRYNFQGSDKELKSVIKSDPKMKSVANRIGGLHLRTTVKRHAKKIGEMNSQDKANFIRKEILRGGSASHPVSMVTTGGENDNYSTVHKDPSKDFDHILKDHEKISHRVAGNSIVFNHPEHGDFASIRLKYESSPIASTIKGAGGAVSSKKKKINLSEEVPA